MTPAEYAVTVLHCPYCKSQPGKKCRTIPGGNITTCHSDRYWMILLGWRQGYNAGYADGHGTAPRITWRKP